MLHKSNVHYHGCAPNATAAKLISDNTCADVVDLLTVVEYNTNPANLARAGGVVGPDSDIAVAVYHDGSAMVAVHSIADFDLGGNPVTSIHLYGEIVQFPYVGVVDWDESPYTKPNDTESNDDATFKLISREGDSGVAKFEGTPDQFQAIKATLEALGINVEVVSIGPAPEKN